MPITSNKKVKDTLFRKYFCEEQKENVLALYNALNNSNYTNIDDLTITTIEDVLYMRMKNDLSFLIDGQFFLIEHQSTINPNMPIRALLYSSRFYETFISTNHLNIYSSTPLKFPAPNCIVLYNGNTEVSAVCTYTLSSLFEIEGLSQNFEWTVLAYNINPGKNEELLQRCKPLADYMTFVNLMKEYLRKGWDRTVAIRETIDQCIKQHVMSDFLVKHRSEVFDMCLTEYDEQATMESFKKEYLEQGEIKGRTEGKIEGKEEECIKNMRNLMKNGNYSFEEAAKLLGYTLDEVLPYKDKILQS
ncbi:MAG: hypothetical protein KBT48_09160 [Firmicutes bacterium]|nr:hypothetical protein [Bacillota bacterium]